MIHWVPVLADSKTTVRLRLKTWVILIQLPLEKATAGSSNALKQARVAEFIHIGGDLSTVVFAGGRK